MHTTMTMNGLPLDLFDEILLRMEPKAIAMMRCTNKSIKSHLTDPRFQYPSWVRRLSLFHLSSYGARCVRCLPLVSSCDYMPLGNEAQLYRDGLCYIFGSCSGLLLLYMGYLFVANPFTKRFRILDHSGSKLLPQIVAGVEKDDPNDPDSSLVRTERAMCVGFAVDPHRTTINRFKIICILEMETMYRFEISDGDSWRLSKTTITTTSSKSGLKKRMKPVYVDGSLHWLRNDWSIIAFNPETEQARLVPSSFHPTPDTKQLFATNEKINLLTLISGTKRAISVYTLLENHKWTLARQIKNVSMEESRLGSWDVVAYDGKCLVLWEKPLGTKFGVLLHVYDMEANSWGVLGLTPCRTMCVVRDFYKFTPSLFHVQEDEQTKAIVASDDQNISYVTEIMGLIDTISERDFTQEYISKNIRPFQFDI